MVDKTIVTGSIQVPGASDRYKYTAIAARAKENGTICIGTGTGHDPNAAIRNATIALRKNLKQKC